MAVGDLEGEAEGIWVRVGVTEGTGETVGMLDPVGELEGESVLDDGELEGR